MLAQHFEKFPGPSHRKFGRQLVALRPEILATPRHRAAQRIAIDVSSAMARLVPHPVRANW